MVHARHIRWESDDVYVFVQVCFWVCLEVVEQEIHLLSRALLFHMWLEDLVVPMLEYY